MLFKLSFHSRHHSLKHSFQDSSAKAANANQRTEQAAAPLCGVKLITRLLQPSPLAGLRDKRSLVYHGGSMSLRVSLLSNCSYYLKRACCQGTARWETQLARGGTPHRDEPTPIALQQSTLWRQRPFSQREHWTVSQHCSALTVFK